MGVRGSWVATQRVIESIIVSSYVEEAASV